MGGLWVGRSTLAVQRERRETHAGRAQGGSAESTWSAGHAGGCNARRQARQAAQAVERRWSTWVGEFSSVV